MLAAACVEGPSSTSPTGDTNASEEGAAGTVGAQLTLPGGEHLSSVSYALTNGTNTYTGTVDVSGSSGASFVVSGVASGVGYILRISGTSDDTHVACSGSSAPFAVSNRATTTVLVQLVCIATGEAGGLTIGGTPSNCAVWNTIVANPGAALAGGSVTLNAAATAPDPGQMTFAWTVTGGTGTISNNTSAVTANDAGATDTATFTCPAVGAEVDTIQLFVGDGPLPDGGSCPASYTTGTITVTCGGAPCTGVPGAVPIVAAPNTATGTCPNGYANLGIRDSSGNFCCSVADSGIPCFVGIASPDTATGTCPSGQVNTGTLRDSNGDYCCSLAPPPPPDAGSSDATTDGAIASCDGATLVPCTAAGQSCCVPCVGNLGGTCTQTEAAFVAHDIAAGHATFAGDAADSCYTCLLNGGCLDDFTFGDVDHECGDRVGVLDAGAKAGTSEVTLCLNTVSCILATSCASAATSGCYCGTAGVATACQGNPAPGPINGACEQVIADGLGFPPSDGTDITKHLTDTTLPAGMADQIFQCALSNTCTACLH
jgi:hypothetical protein